MVSERNTTNEIFEGTTFREYLLGIYLSRVETNKRYSIRSFAKQLSTDPTSLSRIMYGKRKPTAKTIADICRNLPVSPMDIDHFIQLESDNSSQELHVAFERNSLEGDKFRVVADWYHFAILELICLENFSSTPQEISRLLNISISDAEDAVGRLTRLKLIKVLFNKNGKKYISTSNTTVGEPMSDARKELQRQFLVKAMESLQTVPFELRDQSSMTLAFDPNLLPEAKKMLQEFRRKFTDKLLRRSKKTAVYHLNLSFFPLTKVETSNE